MTRQPLLLLLRALLLLLPLPLLAQSPSPPAAQKIILDTDIGDDADDAYALALALSSPKLQLLGVTTAWGDTALRTRLAARFLATTGHADVPVAAGPATHSPAPFTQAHWAQGQATPAEGWPDAIAFLSAQIRRYPGQITLIAIAPFSNIGALIDKDPAAFRQLKRVILMGGSIRRGYGDLGYTPDHGPDPEYNVAMDVPAARKLFASGVPLFVMPLDSTQLKLEEVERNLLFSAGTQLTNTLSVLTSEWTEGTQNATPTLFDAMAVAFAIDPTLCPTQPLRIAIDDRGYTRVVPGSPNANVCLQSDSDRFFHFLLPALLPAPWPDR